MKLAIISDTHFGDPSCELFGLDGKPVRRDGKTTTRYDEFKQYLLDTFYPDPLKKFDPLVDKYIIDYLILVGDVFDYAISQYCDAYSVANAFFIQLLKDNIAAEIVYIPGNHDEDFWHFVDYEVNVIRPIQNNYLPKPLRMALPALIDDRNNGNSPSVIFATADINPKEERDSPNPNYGLFLDRLFDEIKKDKEDSKKSELSVNVSGINNKTSSIKPRFWVAYPNLYLTTRSGETFLITHGHYFDTFWNLGSELTIAIAEDDLKENAGDLMKESGCPKKRITDQEVDIMNKKMPGIKIYPDEVFGKYIEIKYIVGMDYPLNQLACSGIGQCGPLANIVRVVQREGKDIFQGCQPKRIKKYLNRLPKALASIFNNNILSFLDKLFNWPIKEIVKCGLSKYTHPRDLESNQKFLSKSVDRVGRYLLSCELEVTQINVCLIKKGGVAIDLPEKVIFGHTHKVTGIASGGDNLEKRVWNREIKLFNTGGWLKDAEAEVFVYESSGEFKSKTI